MTNLVHILLLNITIQFQQHEQDYLEKHDPFSISFDRHSHMEQLMEDLNQVQY